MVLLRAILVVLSAAIDSSPAPSVKENENAPATLPPESLLDSTASNGCKYQLLPYFDEEEGIDTTGGGFLAVSCTKSCPEGTQDTVTNGNPCIVTWSYLDHSTITVLVGSCQNGSCNPGDSSVCRNITLAGGESEEEEEAEE
uniref:Evasin n=1 Tax=Ixodes ricinus TaxID=34613 RepID=A0A090XCZ6_IXORI